MIYVGRVIPPSNNNLLLLPRTQAKVEQNCRIGTGQICLLNLVSVQIAYMAIERNRTLAVALLKRRQRPLEILVPFLGPEPLDSGCMDLMGKPELRACVVMYRRWEVVPPSALYVSGQLPESPPLGRAQRRIPY